jgi:hypothetical protein
MRIVFLLVAEERGLLPVAENQLYATEYAVSTLLEQLEADEYRNRSAMQRRSRAWQRLLALARALHAGVEHDRLRMPAYGGDLFDPDEHPFLEGRIPIDDKGRSWRQLDVGVVDDYTVLGIMRQLQVANGQRISFRSLDVEQIGHVYESLLDHSAVMVRPEDVAVLGLVGRSGDEPELSLSILESAEAEGLSGLAKYLANEGVAADSQSVLDLLDAGLDPDSEVANTINIAVGNDQALLDRVEPFAPLLRSDSRGVALIWLPGDVYVTTTSSKRDTGTAYTPRSLAEEVAKHALDPLIYEPGPQNELDESCWVLRPPGDLLQLKICDPAVGSAAILVAAARYLAEAVLQSRINYKELPASALDTAASDVELLDVRVAARIDVVSNCIYGIDRDPMAVEMAKLSMWLITMARDRPFTFLDHSIRVGDSLLGLTSLDQLRALHLEPNRVTGTGRSVAVQFGADDWWDVIDDSIQQIKTLRAALRGIRVESIEDARRKAELNDDAIKATQELAVVGNAICAAYLSHAGGTASDRDAALASLGPLVAQLSSNISKLDSDAENSFKDDNPNALVSHRPMHWPLAFPEVFLDGDGFDAIVANPPFIKSQGLRDSVGSNYRDYCSTFLAGSRKGKADFIAYFAWRITQLAHLAGFLATNSIAQGDTLKVGLLPITDSWTIFRGVRSIPWPGAAGVHISKVWMTDDEWRGQFYLDGHQVSRIAASLETGGQLNGPPLALKANADKAFQGYQVIADGFELSSAEADEMIRQDPGSESVIRLFVNGNTLNGPPPLFSPDRRIIDFGTMSKAKARDYPSAFAHVERYAKPEIEAKAAPKPNGKPSSYEAWADTWWQFWGPRPGLRKAISGMSSVLAMVRTSKVFYPVFVPADWCLTDALVVFAYDDFGHFGILSSSFHWWWAIKPPGTGGSSLKSDPRYTPTTSFQTFPQPAPTEQVQSAGEALHSCREQLMRGDGIGLRELYSRINNKEDHSNEVVRLRELHIALDVAVKNAYAQSDPDHPWDELNLDHDYYDCGYLGTRLTLSDTARNTFLSWLLELNFRRYAEENNLSLESVLRKTGNA